MIVGRKKRDIPLSSLVYGVIAFSGLYLLGRDNYLFFHSVIEIIAISIAFTIFLMIWSTRRIVANNSLFFLGAAYLSIGVLGLLHMLTYQGMGIFELSTSANTATQLWMAARGVESLTIILFALLIKIPAYFKFRKVILFIYVVITFILITSIFLWEIFPDSYIEGYGLTPFKKSAEYIVCLIFLAALVLLGKERHLIDSRVRRFLMISICFSIAAEMSFTLYSDVYGLTNAAGHYLKLLANLFIFNALIYQTLQSPYTTIFRELRMSNKNKSISESLHSAMVANIPDILGILNAEGTIIYKSDNLKANFGWDNEDLIGKEAWFCLHPDDVQMAKETFAMLVNDSDTPRTIVLKYRHKDGHYSPIELTARNLLNNPDINGILINYHDISNKLKSERDLQQSEERFRTLHNASFGGITIHDKGVILECNQGLSDLTGYNYEELIGMNSLNLVTESSRNMVMSRFLSGFEKAYETTGLRKDGSEYPTRLESRNIPYRGKIARVVEFRDITKEKETEREKARLQDQLLQVQKMESVGRLAGGIAHDFNNMLGVILGYTDILLRQTCEEDSVHYLNEIKKASERSAELTRQLLAFARKQVVNPEILDLNETLEKMMDMLEKMIGSDISLVWQPGQVKGRVNIDPNQLNLILVNLCLNARDAISKDGTVTISTGNTILSEQDCRYHRERNPGKYLTLIVSDSGRGMDMEKQAHIFEPFFSTELESADRGMGLPSVYGCVKQNNGFIELKSEKGRGTVFTIHLPQVEIEELSASSVRRDSDNV